MSRHAAATSAGRSRTVQRTAPAVPRRMSGPVAPNRRDTEGSRADRDPRPRVAAPRAFTAPQPRRLAYGGVAIASRVAGVAVDVSASRLMDRLVRGRLWIGVVAFCLIGLVATQVSLLKLNSGIGRAVQTASTLERSNASLRAEISRLSAGDRIQRLATAGGMVMPAPSDVTYLRAGGGQGVAVRAAQRMHAPDPNVAPGPAGAATATALPVTGAVAGVATAIGPDQAPPVTTAPAGTAPAATAPAATAPAATAPAATAPAATAPAVTAPAATAPAAPAAAATTPATNAAATGAATPSGGAAPPATP